MYEGTEDIFKGHGQGSRWVAHMQNPARGLSLSYFLAFFFAA